MNTKIIREGYVMWVSPRVAGQVEICQTISHIEATRDIDKVQTDAADALESYNAPDDKILVKVSR